MMDKHRTQPLDTCYDREAEHEFELIKNVCAQRSRKHRPFVQADQDGGLIQVAHSSVM